MSKVWKYNLKKPCFQFVFKHKLKARWDPEVRPGTFEITSDDKSFEFKPKYFWGLDWHRHAMLDNGGRGPDLG